MDGRQSFTTGINTNYDADPTPSKGGQTRGASGLPFSTNSNRQCGASSSVLLEERNNDTATTKQLDYVTNEEDSHSPDFRNRSVELANDSLYHGMTEREYGQLPESLRPFNAQRQQ